MTFFFFNASTAAVCELWNRIERSGERVKVTQEIIG